jgi:four helix bundle protein
MARNRFTQLEVWKKAHQNVLDVYRLTQGFPADERFLMVSQMRRAAISIPANIAEGYGRRAPRDKARCYTISQGSAEELAYLVILARDLGYAKEVGAGRGRRHAPPPHRPNPGGRPGMEWTGRSRPQILDSRFFS